VSDDKTMIFVDISNDYIDVSFDVNSIVGHRFSRPCEAVAYLSSKIIVVDINQHKLPL